MYALCGGEGDFLDISLKSVRLKYLNIIHFKAKPEKQTHNINNLT